MLGLMQTRPLMISSIIQHAARNHARTEIVSKTVEGTLHRTTYAAIERRMRRLVRALQRLGRDGRRPGGHARLERFPAPRGRITRHRAWAHVPHHQPAAWRGRHRLHHRRTPATCVLFADTSFVPLLESLRAAHPALRAVVMMAERGDMPEVTLPPGMALHCYETLMAAADEDYRLARVRRAHRQRALLHVRHDGAAEGRALQPPLHRAARLCHQHGGRVRPARADRVMPVVPMFHVNAWGCPYRGAAWPAPALILPGRHLDGASLAALMNEERVTTRPACRRSGSACSAPARDREQAGHRASGW